MAKYKKELVPQVIMERRCSVCGEWTEQSTIGHGGYIDLANPSVETMSLNHRPVLYGRRRYQLLMYAKWLNQRRRGTLAEREKYAALIARAKAEKKSVTGEPELVA